MECQVALSSTEMNAAVILFNLNVDGLNWEGRTGKYFANSYDVQIDRSKVLVWVMSHFWVILVSTISEGQIFPCMAHPALLLTTFD